MCRVFETSRKQVSFILAREVAEINHARVNCWCCTLQYFIWPDQEWNKMDLSSFHSSWLALLALSKGCFPSRFRHVCHVLAFSASPIGAGLCSCQPAAFEVHLSSGWYEDCFKPTALQIRGYPLRPVRSASEFSGASKLAETAFHRATVES